jgi:Tfp pilus assembly protein PilF
VPSATRYLLALLLGLVTGAPALAQRDRDTWTTPSPNSFEVSGQVRMADSRLAAVRVPIRLERFGGGLVDQIDTDSGGRFRFTNLPRGYYKVVINTRGFKLIQQDADLQVVVRTYLQFDLVREGSELPGNARAGEVIDARVPPAAREEFERGRAASAKKSPDEALRHLQTAVQLYPDFFEARLLLATAWMDLRKWEAAEEELRKAGSIKTENAAVMLALGEVYWRQKRSAEAEKVLLAGLKLDDKSWQGFFTLARLYWDQNETARAGPPIGKTLQLKPDFAEAHLLAGNVLLRLGQQERALVEYQEYLRLEPKGEFADQTKELVQKLKQNN